MTTKVIKADNEFQLVKLMNQEREKLDIFATQPIQKNDGSWVCFLYYNSTKFKGARQDFSKSNPEKSSFVTSPLSNPATQKQLNYLKGLGIKIPKGLTKIEAIGLIEEATRK